MSDGWRQKLESLPQGPGVYVFKAADGSVLYVGKASSLRNRVRSYFQAGTSDQRYFIDRLERDIGDIETFVTATEKEAALLENGLIKQYKPRYNFKLRDDKEYLSLRLDEKARWARLEVVRRPKQDGARYFGPYHSATTARATLRVVNRHFQLRTCTDTEMRARTRPCLQYQIKRCLAPCVLDVDKLEYAAQIRNVGLFLEGRHDELVQHLQGAMREASDQLKYEVAATYRDQIRAVDSARESQRVALVRDADQDVFGFFRSGDKVELAVLMVRHGRVTGVRTFDLRDVRLPDDELIAGFVAEYYHLGSFVPDEVLIPTEIEGQAGLAEVLSEQRSGKVLLARPQRGNKAQLLRMAMENAAHAFKEKARAREDLETRLRTIADRLGLPKLPHRFECIDVSHTSGKETVAAVVAFRDGEPDRKHYRSFHIRSVSGGDDYGAMREALTRRFKRGKAHEAGWELPDLLVVDGGRGQLGIAQAVLAELELTDLPIAALAKEKPNTLGAELVDRVYTPGRLNPVELRSAMSSLGMLAQARDEAHRVSNALRIRLGKGQRLRTQLDDVPFVGKKTRVALLRKLGSIEAVSAASVEQLQAAGATLRQARAIVDHLSRAVPTAEGSEEDALENAFDAGDPEVESEGSDKPLEAVVDAAEAAESPDGEVEGAVIVDSTEAAAPADSARVNDADSIH